MSVEWIWRSRRADIPEGPPPKVREFGWPDVICAGLWVGVLVLVLKFVEVRLGR